MAQSFDVVALALADATRAARKRLDAQLKAFDKDLSQSRWAVLTEIERAEPHHALTQIQLADRLGIETATLVGLLNNLVKAGWVSRRRSPVDGRANVIELTTSGRALKRRATPVVQRFRRDLFAGLEQQDLLTALRVFRTIKRNADAFGSDNVGKRNKS